MVHTIDKLKEKNSELKKVKSKLVREKNRMEKNQPDKGNKDLRQAQTNSSSEVTNRVQEQPARERAEEQCTREKQTPE